MLEEGWSKKVEAAKQEAQKAKETTEKKVGSVIDRLHQLTEREAKREAQRGKACCKVLLYKVIQPSCSIKTPSRMYARYSDGHVGFFLKN